MASDPGTQSKRWAASRRRSTKASAPPSEASPEPADEQPAPAATPASADIYRSLFNQLRRAFGGTIDDANAEAIAFAAAELYHKDVEPRLWEHKTAQEILDGFGVPRSGTFTRYSLSDRLLLLRRAANPSRAEQAHALLTELGAPEADAGGARLSLKDRLQALLEGTEPLPTLPRGSGANGEPGEGPEPGGAAENPPLASRQVVEALETIRRATTSGIDGEQSEPVTPPADLPVAELVGLGTVIAGIQEELIVLRQAVETVQGRLDEVLTLLRAGPGVGAGPVVAGDATSTVAPDVEPAADATPLPALDTEAPADAVAPADATPAPAPPADAPHPDDVTQVVPIVPGQIAASTATRRRRGLPKLIVITVILGLLIAGVAIAISAIGWSELRDSINIGWVDVSDGPPFGAAARWVDVDGPLTAGA